MARYTILKWQLALSIYFFLPACCLAAAASLAFCSLSTCNVNGFMRHGPHVIIYHDFCSIATASFNWSPVLDVFATLLSASAAALLSAFAAPLSLLMLDLCRSVHCRRHRCTPLHASPSQKPVLLSTLQNLPWLLLLVLVLLLLPSLLQLPPMSCHNCSECCCCTCSSHLLQHVLCSSPSAGITTVYAACHRRLDTHRPSHPGCRPTGRGRQRLRKHAPSSQSSAPPPRRHARCGP